MADFSELIELVHSINDDELLADFLVSLTTPKERDELLKRVEIVRRLLRGERQLTIAKELGVGIATVSRGSKELAAGHFKVLRSENK